MHFTLFLASILPLLIAAQDTARLVTLKLGSATVSGQLIVNAQGQTVQAFRGIRYAEAPTGSNRWKPTKLLELKGNIDARSFSSICYGDRRFNVQPPFPESEDCLFLNVYAPAGANTKSNLPVMVWTHGGAWVSGNGNIYDGRNLVGVAGNNIVYVSFNYRLGLFGFLANQQLLKEGNGANFALRDMQNAFKWVRVNIQQFGGNPWDITAFGESAGAFMIAMQMVTDGGSQQLFDKAILESGGFPSASQVMSTAEQDKYFSAVASGVGCTNANPAKVLACLRGKDASALMASGGTLDWRPIVDNKVLTDIPYKLVDANRVSRIPTILGTNTDEGYLFVSNIDKDELVIPTVSAMYSGLTSNELSAINTLYPSTSFPTPTLRVAEIVGDLLFVCPSEKLTETLAQCTSTYHYRFNETSPLFGVGPSLAIHTAELPYVFNDNANVAIDASAQALVNNVQTYWTNFARYGSPNGQFFWPKYEISSKKQIVLQKSITVEKNGAYMPGHADRCVFWNKVEQRMASSDAFVSRMLLAELMEAAPF